MRPVVLSHKALMLWQIIAESGFDLTDNNCFQNLESETELNLV